MQTLKTAIGNVIAAVGLLTSNSIAQTPAKKPNVVFILIDDMGYADLSCYGKEAGATPRIDQLAKEGIRFTQYYVSSPICSPSRCSVITGQQPQRWKITSYIDNSTRNAERGMANWLDLKAPSIARSLKVAGYATGHFGKWHLGGGRDVGDAPLITEYGFDESLTQFEGLGDRVLPITDNYDGSKPERMGLGVASEKLGRGKVTWADRSEITTKFADRAIEFIDKSVAAGKPFYVDLWPDDVHSPFFPPKDLRTDEAKRALYKAVVRATDRQLTPLLDHIKNTPALRDNTIVILASDNGPEPGAGLAGTFRGTKGQLYEGGVREPFIVWAPAFMHADKVGSVDESSVLSSLDLMPSVLKLAGVAATEKPDGQDASAAWLGESPLAERSAPLFWRRPPDRPGPPKEPLPDLSMREGDWKLLCMADGSSPQLYDLKRDAEESKNLAEKESDRVKAMREKLLAWNASIPKDHPTQAATRPTSE